MSTNKKSTNKSDKAKSLNKDNKLPKKTKDAKTSEANSNSKNNKSKKPKTSDETNLEGVLDAELISYKNENSYVSDSSSKESDNPESSDKKSSKKSKLAKNSPDSFNDNKDANSPEHNAKDSNISGTSNEEDAELIKKFNGTPPAAASMLGYEHAIKKFKTSKGISDNNSPNNNSQTSTSDSEENLDSEAKSIPNDINEEESSKDNFFNDSISEVDDDEDDNSDDKDRPMSLREHLVELRKRLTYIFIFSIAGFLVCFPFADVLYDFLKAPLASKLPPGATLIALEVGEVFFTYMKLSFVAGLFIASPFIFYQIWAFISPGLYESERRFIVPVTLASAIFFLLGGAFCYFVAFPVAFEFFLGFATDGIKATPAVNAYYGFALQLLFAFGLIFELPVFIFFLSRMGIVTPSWLRDKRRYAILIIFIVAAVLTPPDVISQLLMAAPMLLLYEVGILVAAIFGKKKPKKEENLDEEQETNDKDQSTDNTEENSDNENNNNTL